MSDREIFYIPVAAAANTSAKISVHPPANEIWAIEELWSTNNIAITQSDTDYITIKFSLNDDFTTYPIISTAVTSKTTGGTNFTALLKTTYTLNTDKSKLLATSALPITIDIAESGTGPAFSKTFGIAIRRFPTS